MDQIGVEPTTSCLQSRRSTIGATDPKPNPATQVHGRNPAWNLGDLNSSHPACKAGALPDELRPLAAPTPQGRRNVVVSQARGANHFLTGKPWRIGVTIPLPLVCHTSALPSELIPRRYLVVMWAWRELNPREPTNLSTRYQREGIHALGGKDSRSHPNRSYRQNRTVFASVSERSTNQCTI